MNDELENVWNAVAVGYFKVLYLFVWRQIDNNSIVSTTYVYVLI
jgi:hypothetical protein